MQLRLLDVLDRDQPDAAIVVVDHDQLLDAMLVEEPLRPLHVDALLDGDEPLLGHQLGHTLVRVGGEAHVAIGEDADQPAFAGAVDAGLDHRNARDLIVGHQLERVGEGPLGVDGHRVHHHARLELLHLRDLGGLELGLEIAVDHADAAGLRHGDGELAPR